MANQRGDIYLPNRVREFRLRYRISQIELGERAGVSAKHVSELERYLVRLTMEAARKLAGPLGCQPIELFDPEQIKAIEPPEAVEAESA